MKKIRFIAMLIAGVIFSCHANAEKLVYEEVLKDALNNSHEIRSATIECGIRKEAVKEKHYGLFPDLSIKANSEYTDNFTDRMGDIVVGDTMISGSTRYQNAASLNLIYPLVDYGLSRNNLKIAENDSDQASYILDKTRMDIETSVLEKYALLYLYHVETEKRRDIISIQEKLGDMEKRSNAAGISGMHDVLYQDIQLAEENEKLSVLETQILVALEDLGYLTGRKYTAEKLEITKIPEDQDSERILETQNPADHTSNPEYRYYEAEKKKRQIEKDIVRNDFYPKFNIYAKYNFYNSNSDIQDTYERLREQGYTVGVFTNIPITENFKRIHTFEKTSLNVSKSEIEASKKLAEIERDFTKLGDEYRYLKADLEKKKKRLELVNSRVEMIKRYEASRIMPKKKLYEEKIMLATKEIELEKQINEQVRAMKKIIIQIRGGH